jgi:hypothetical protein
MTRSKRLSQTMHRQSLNIPFAYRNNLGHHFRLSCCLLVEELTHGFAKTKSYPMPCIIIALQPVKHHPASRLVALSRFQLLPVYLTSFRCRLLAFLIIAEAFDQPNENTHVALCEIRGSSLCP